MDEELKYAIKLVNERGGSISMLKRYMGISHKYAQDLMNEMEKIGVVGPDNGAKPRYVLKKLNDIIKNDES